MDAQQYDSDLQMFRDTAPRLNADKLRFMRWMADNGWLTDDLPVSQPIIRDRYTTLPLD